MKPYTYLLKHIPTNTFYYGVRYSKNCDPSDLWSSYFTSSKHIKKLIEIYGKESFSYEIRKTFNNEKDARLWEEKVLKRIKAVERDDFLNKHHCYGPPRMSGENHPLFGIGHTDASKMKMRKPHKKLSDETKKKMSSSRMGEKNPMYGIGAMKGKKHSKETKEKLSIKRLNNPILYTDEIRKKISDANKQYKWWTDGVTNIRSIECPLGFSRGRIINKK